MKAPPKLYKYCSLNANSLRSILRAQVFHSPPVEFNDPLDCNPTLELDLRSSEMETLLHSMMVQRRSPLPNIKTMFKQLRYIAQGRDGINDPGEYEASYAHLLGEEVRRLLREELGNKGVLALSETWDEPLMWSHYGAQHEGICIEYETTGFAVKRLRAVDYNAPRFVRAHDIYRWKCDGDARAEQRVFDTYFYAKAPQWSYEKEWRDIADKAGANASHFDVTAIHLGMRTDLVWKWVLVKLLHLDRQIKLYEVVADDKSFRLHRTEMDRDELESRGVDQPAFRAFSVFIGKDGETFDIPEEMLRALAVGAGDGRAQL